MRLHRKIGCPQYRINLNLITWNIAIKYAYVTYLHLMRISGIPSDTTRKPLSTLNAGAETLKNIISLIETTYFCKVDYMVKIVVVRQS